MNNITLYLFSRDYRVHRRAVAILGEVRFLQAYGASNPDIRFQLRLARGKL